MNADLLRFHAHVIACTVPEDIFGTDPAQVKTTYRRFALLAHEDRYQRPDEKRLAHVAFALLNTLHQQAVEKIAAGTYGTAAPAPNKSRTPAAFHTKQGTYIIQAGFAAGDVSSVYTAHLDDTTPVLIKIALAPVYNPFVALEAGVLDYLQTATAGVAYRTLFPTLRDTAKVLIDGTERRVTVMPPSDGFHTLHDVVAQYPDGLDPRHLIWVWRRLLAGLAFAHSHGIIHGAVLPTHLLIFPGTPVESHSIRLIDWCFSSDKKHPLMAMSTPYRSWYPPEVARKDLASPALDFYMSALSMNYLVGGTFDEVPVTVPAPLRRLLESCWIKNPARRPQSGWDLGKELKEVAETVFGKRQYMTLSLV